MANTPAGWYPDSTTGKMRWWDGHQWTNDFQPDPSAAPSAPPAQPSATPTPQTVATAPAADRPLYKQKGLLIALGIGALVIFGALSTETETDPDAKPDSSETTSPDAPTPTTPEGKLLAAVKDTDRDVESPKVVKYMDTDDGVKYAEIQFKVGDNLSNGTIRTGIGLDVFAMAEAALKSGVPFDELAFRGMFPLTDKFGNTKSGQVFFTTFTRDTLEKINWDNRVVTQFDNIENLSIDGIVLLHPDFRE